MGLFSRGSKSDVPMDGPEPSTNGHAPEDDPTPPEVLREPEVFAEGAPEVEEWEPADQEAPEIEEWEPADQEAPDREESEPAIEEASEAEESERLDEAPAAGAPEATPAPPPANRAAPDPDDQGRISVHEALAPSRQPGSGKLPGAHIGDASERRAQIISFANQKGGVAKTTTTLNLAVAFDESGHDVLAVDLDPQGNLTMSQGIDPDKVDASMYDVLVDHIPIREVIHDREIDIAVASIDLAGAEIAMSMQIGRERSLEKALAAVVDDYDFICIDTPPSLGLLTVNALTASDKVIVPVQCEYLSMRGLVQLQNTLQMIRENLNPRVHIEGILPTMLDSRTVHAKEAVEILEENFGELVFKSRIRKAIKFAEAPVRGSSVLKYDPKSNAANYYRELAKEVLTNGAS
jgi:chromosome partitioning protein